MKVAIYCRYSTDVQDKISIAAQAANCDALAAREGLEVVARFADEARSGNDDQRPNYRKMLDALKRGDFAGIVCDETSRATRNQSELHRLVAELRFRDQFLITADGVDTRSEMSEIVLSVRAAIDSMESRKIGYRVFRSLRERHKDGHCAGGRIFGYRIEPAGDYKRRVLDPELAAVVREIFERFAAGESAKGIVRDLNERRIMPPGAFFKNRIRRAHGWTSTTITGCHAKASGILRNPIYRGVSTWNKRRGRKVPGTNQRIQKRRPAEEWIEIRDEALRVVPDAIWNTVQTRLARQAATASKGRGRPARYVLSGVLKCASCGGSYVMANEHRYKCSSHTNGRDSLCEQKRGVSRQRAEQKLLATIKAEYLAPDVIKEMVKAAQARVRETKEPDRAYLRGELERIELELGNVVDALAKLGTSGALLARVRELEAAKAALAGSLAAKRGRVAQIAPNVEGLLRKRVELIEQTLAPRADADEALIERGRAALRELLGEIRVVEEGEDVFAEIHFGRWVDINHGAQERTRRNLTP